MKDTDFLKMARDIAVYHHEKWNGTGYPEGLREDAIPLCARIMAIADVFDALVSVRVYKSAVEPEKALEIIFSESGSHFDPDVLKAVNEAKEQLIEIARPAA